MLKPVNNRPVKSVELSMTAPKECYTCGWIAPKQPGDSDKWALISQVGPFFLLVCPKCGNVVVNTDWKRNAQNIEEAQNRRIVQADSCLLAKPGVRR